MKLTRHAWILWGISLVIVTAVAFLIPFAHTAVYWIVLGCTGMMFILCACTFVRAFRQDQNLESKLLGYPIFKIGCAATLLQIILALILMSLSQLCPVRIAILAEILLFGATVFCLTTRDAARETVVHFEAGIPDTTDAWKAIRAQANALAAETGDPEIRRLAEEIRYADPTPSSLDEAITAQMELLSTPADPAILHQLFALLQQRKMLIKSEK